MACAPGLTGQLLQDTAELVSGVPFAGLQRMWNRVTARRDEHYMSVRSNVARPSRSPARACVNATDSRRRTGL